MSDTFRPEVTVLSAAPFPIKFTVHEYAGVQVFTTDRILTPDEISALSQEQVQGILQESVGKRLLAAEDMREGLLILIPGLIGGYIFGLVERDVGDAAWGWRSANGTTVGILEFDTDDRHCWTCGGMMNLNSLSRLELG